MVLSRTATIVVDFDRTVFASDALYRHLYTLCERRGIRSEDLPLHLGLVHPEKRLFSFFALLQQSGKVKPDQLAMILREIRGYILENAWRYVFPDVKPFLSAAVRAGSKIHILTYGDVEFQLTKFLGSGLQASCNSVTVITEHKWLCGSLFSGEATLFLDDNPRNVDKVKGQYPHVTVVEVKRPGTKYESAHSNLADMQVSQLTWPIRIRKQG